MLFTPRRLMVHFRGFRFFRDIVTQSGRQGTKTRP